jgi:mono/diheme cytochrome c family protein
VLDITDPAVRAWWTEKHVEFLRRWDISAIKLDRGEEYVSQEPTDVFADGRAMRPKVPGTVARGQLDADDHYYRGFKIVKDPNTDREQAIFFDRLPPQVNLTEQFVKRGQDRFNIYCAACHGWDGRGDGPVARRSRDLAEGGSGAPINAADLHGALVRGRPDGHIFNTISNGIRTMPPHAAQIPVEDRWAIVAYVRALQLSQDGNKQ